MKKVAIIGFGSFAKLMVKHLQDDFEILLYSRHPQNKDKAGLSFRFVTLALALKQEIIILAIPAQFIGDFLKTNVALINPNALVLDVASVKQQPVTDMRKFLPKSCQIIGTHPIFGPGSARKGIQGFQIALCPVRCQPETLQKLVVFLENKGLEVLQKTPQEHDKEMAYVLGLTHYIGRALQDMAVPKTDLTTPAYAALLEMQAIQGGHSWELFYSIISLNPYAKEVITQLEAAFAMLDKQLVEIEQKMKLK